MSFFYTTLLGRELEVAYVFIPAAKGWPGVGDDIEIEDIRHEDVSLKLSKPEITEVEFRLREELRLPVSCSPRPLKYS